MATSDPGRLESRVFLLNGGSSVGKTTTARAMQELSPVPLLRVGIDDFLASVPDPWGGGRGGPLSHQGFHYLTLPDGGGTSIGYGEDGFRMLRGWHRAVAALLDAGNSVVVDELILAPAVHADWLEALKDRAATWVRVDCPLDVAERRERDRPHRRSPGLARGTHAPVHAGVGYDLAIDTSELTPEDAARLVLESAATAGPDSP